MYMQQKLLHGLLIFGNVFLSFFVLKDWDKIFLWLYMKNIYTLGTICLLCSFLLNGLWLQADISLSNVR